MIVTIAAVALLQQTPPAPQRDTTPRARIDTIYIGRRDTAAARPPVAPVPSAPGAVAAAPSPRADSAGIFDSPATRTLVERTIRAGSQVPAELGDYTAQMDAAVYLSLRADSAQGGELPVTIDEFAGEVQWARGNELVQTIRGHRVRMLAPTPYTVGSLIDAPWVIPHLYGNTITVFSLASTPGGRARASNAVHPFSWRGLDFYHYTGGDTVRVRTQQGVTTLVPITVRQRVGITDTARTVAGTFWVDVDRNAVARARFGFVDRRGGLLPAESGVFFELENGLVGGRFWLPYRQRREIQISSPLFGGAAAIRMVTAMSGYRLNSGWRPEQPGQRLVRSLERGDSAFAGFARAVGDVAQGLDIADFSDLRAAVRPPSRNQGPIRVSLGYERGDHLFRYNRVEGAFLGLGVRVEPRDPDRRDWDLYATGGYAFAESTARGEVSARWHPQPSVATNPRYTVALTGYRRLRDLQAFRPPLQWDLGYTLGAALAGYDVRDYLDATGGELQLTRRAGPFLARLGGRWERQDSVSMNVRGGLFGGVAKNFPELAAVDPGTHAAAEGELRWTRGAGTLSLGNSLQAALRGEVGLADFQTQRVTAFLSFRRSGKYVSLIGRGDGGVVAGTAPPQFLFRFGGVEGLRGYERNEFGGSQAALGRGRLLLHLPPYGNQPLAQAAGFLIPPLRPAVVFSVDAGWSGVSAASTPSLLRLGSKVTDGVRWSYGTGISVFEDALSVEYVRPGDGGKGKWYVGFVSAF
ncbi:MAG TPA: hypothetical protein VFJ16_31125 [Longimicrobium sp.]|nr:hypothetical protein [Longimicrobium sp.]